MISNSNEFDEYIIVTVTDTGLNHIKNRIENQDAVATAYQNGNFVIAVSDGVGSCKNARLGSQYAVESVLSCFKEVCEELLKKNPDDMINFVVSKWKNLIADNKIDDFCATLKAAIKLDDKIYVFSIGDGIIAISSGEIGVISPTEETLFANQTNCLNSNIKASDFWSEIVEINEEMPFAVFACTDGISGALQQGRELSLVKEIETSTDRDELKAEIENLVLDIMDYSMDDRTVGVVKYER